MKEMIMKTKREKENYHIDTGYDEYEIEQDELDSCIDVLTDKFIELFAFLDDIHDNDYKIFDTIDNWTMGKLRLISNQLKYSLVDIENLKTKLTFDDE